ncbi:flagellar biosynthetic protein FliP [candidate division WOR-1 bacterium RIFOXYD2_FULL_36_8]|uniref:Flagellar biosynthetic protein FliP n=1 Tax=candidate division WOR-1 bacterium RIFOXYB2_FULL_36_35 TaxID=1802578 RepID=A0A1F4RX86_UNCSA|nr:MAG: flagellar biosynthetic protein FliP [candidate division WOR-1 bacterium RIFOXYA2_FULL_36_21]OGC12780.1 MAG: flagellar biosynthetic protein FliP [candidate division WOR-1 bacterium RIFOXYB2_FULL_36_35]OGC15213.1 MAG: flagellar biosynthetic protein FliP [candidate division WOR-1 bacterium RIFOXYA12_FULL_36_13]OGC38339.1 MAG: flagellar biosynthetic protein FliP [candidate division WOR-1 bacterium RIFOXYD2_FULL_36_8]
MKKIWFFVFLLLPSFALAAPQGQIAGQINLNSIMNSPQFSSSIQMIIGIALISLVPFFLISVTGFLRIIIVFSLVRTAIGTQQVPPTSVLVGIAVFMTIFVMNPVWQEVNKKAIEPYNQGKFSEMQAFKAGSEPLKMFMLRQVRENDLALFVKFSNIEPPKKAEDVPLYVVIPAFMISELKTSFQIGFLLFIPFIIIDLVVANILLSLGMFMLSPVMVSLPFKILLFVLVDGWNLITRGLLMSFR